MPTVTLAESAKLSQDMLVSGVIENIITVDRFFDVLPFTEIEGNALSYNRENTLGDVELLAAGGTISAKNPATFTPVTTSLTTIIGDAHVNGLIQATRSNITDQKAVQVASKAKNVGQTFRNQLINGDGTGANVEGLLSLLAAGQTVDSGANGSNLSFDLMDELLDNVTDKNGEVDYIMMPSRTIRSYFALLRALGGAGIGETVQLPSGIEVPGYRGVPIFRNDNIPTNQTKGTATGVTTTVLAGTVDDGSESYGIAGLTAMGEAGIRVTDLGEAENEDESITRIKFYCGLANFSEKGLAGIDGILN
jgi:hypothetical protein